MASSLQLPSFASGPASDAFVPPPVLAHAPSPPLDQSLLMDCRCGIQHESPDDCVELVIYSLFSGATNPSTQLRSPIPRDPDVAELLLQSVSKPNHLSNAIYNIMRQYRSKDVATTAAVFFLFYRMFRVCIQRSVPESKPTDKICASIVAYAPQRRISS